MWTVERILIGFLIYAAAAAWRPGVRPVRRAAVTIVCVADGLLIWQLAGTGWSWWPAARAWQPPLQILIAYWISGGLFVKPQRALETWLADVDRRLFDRLGLERFVRRAPRALLESFELSYLCVYAMLPVGFAVALAIEPNVDADTFWTPVVVADLACYAALPWLQTRPPRALGDQMWIEARRLFSRRLNLLTLRLASIQVNTLPSAHAAGAVATALAVGSVAPAAALGFHLLAAGIVAGSVLGRYHFIVDSVLGIATAVAAYLAFQAWPATPGFYS